jgi:hypothetical protein
LPAGEEESGMSTTAKRQIIEGLDDLPEQSLVAVAEFVDFLRAKAVAGPTALGAARVVKLGGLWKGHVFSEQDIDEARGEAWSDLGREPS